MFTCAFISTLFLMTVNILPVSTFYARFIIDTLQKSHRRSLENLWNSKRDFWGDDLVNLGGDWILKIFENHVTLHYRSTLTHTYHNIAPSNHKNHLCCANCNCNYIATCPNNLLLSLSLLIGLLVSVKSKGKEARKGGSGSRCEENHCKVIWLPIDWMIAVFSPIWQERDRDRGWQESR